MTKYYGNNSLGNKLQATGRKQLSDNDNKNIHIENTGERGTKREKHMSGSQPQASLPAAVLI